MRTTIRQIAEKAGVSRTTVSNVLQGRHAHVAEQTRRLVLELVREMEYIPVRPALQNRHTPTHTIAVPVDNPDKLQWGINSGTYHGVCAAAMRHGYDVALLLRADPDWAAERGEVQLLDRRSDGVIFASPLIGETAQTFETLARHAVPVVACYRRDVPDGVVWVDPDNRAAMFDAVAHLVENGHRRIAHLTVENSTEFDKAERRRYFAEALRRYDLPRPEGNVFGAGYFAATPQLAREIVDAGYTGVVCMNDLLAIDLMRAMLAGGMNVPEDLSLIGVDGRDAEAHGLTSMEFSFYDVGYHAAEALIERIGGRPARDCCRVLPVRLTPRRSVKRLA